MTCVELCRSPVCKLGRFRSRWRFPALSQQVIEAGHPPRWGDGGHTTVGDGLDCRLGKEHV